MMRSISRTVLFVGLLFILLAFAFTDVILLGWGELFSFVGLGVEVRNKIVNG